MNTLTSVLSLNEGEEALSPGGSGVTKIYGTR